MLVSTSDIDAFKIETPTNFCGFDKRYATYHYIRNLPHWRQTGSTYFVTFRTKDSIPKQQWINITNAAKDWQAKLANSPRNPKILREYTLFKRRFQRRIETILEECHGACLLKDPAFRRHVIEALMFYQNKRYRIDAGVIMPNHVHLVITPFIGHHLETSLGKAKSYSSRQINQLASRKGSFWMPENFDHIIRNGYYQRTIRYLLKNPIKARLKPDEFWYQGPGEELLR